MRVSDKENGYGWLKQFDDGVRVDLTVQAIQYEREHIHDDKLCKILMDKANVLRTYRNPQVGKLSFCILQTEV